MTESDHKSKLLFVIQRYGLEVDGGAELYCRWLAEKLSRCFEITVLTTCARDYTSWDNAYPPGPAYLNGIRVIRQSVNQGRDMARFNTQTATLLSRTARLNDQYTWLKDQGPFSSGLIRYLKGNQNRYDMIFFFTYLYYPTVIGTFINPSRSILIPTAHNEPVAYFDIFHHLYRRVAGLLYLTRSEKSFVESTYDVSAKPGALLGTGIDIPPGKLNGRQFIEKYHLAEPVLMYIGRVERGKGCLELISFFEKYTLSKNFSGTLVFAGRKHIDTDDSRQVRFLGFIPEDEIAGALQAAHLVMVPSTFESLSILLLQGFLSGKPSIVNAASPVLVDHCIQSNAGLYYNNYIEFEYCMDLLLNRNDFYKQLSRNGIDYINNNFIWDIVIDRFNHFYNNFLNIS